MKRLILLLALGWLVSTTTLLVLGSWVGWLPWHLQTMVGQSMEPALPSRSLLVIGRTNHLQAGDVVAYRLPGRQTGIARVVRVANQGGADEYSLQADQASASYTVMATAIVGQVLYHWSVAGPVYQFLRSWPGITLGVYLPAIGLAAYETNRLARRLAEFSLG